MNPYSTAIPYVHRQFTADKTSNKVADLSTTVLGRRYTSWSVADSAKRHICVPGENFHSLAAHFYGNADLWWVLADVNPDITYPLDFPDGTQVLIPPLQDTHANA